MFCRIGEYIALDLFYNLKKNFFYIYIFFFGGGGGRGHVLFHFLCNLQQYCDSAYNKLNSHQQKEFINITKINYIVGKNRRERER